MSAHERAEGSRGGASEIPRIDIGSSENCDLLDHAPCGLLEISNDGTILWVNLQFAQLFDKERVSFVGRRFQDLLARGGKIFYETQFAPSLFLRKHLEEISFEFDSLSRRIPVFVNAIYRPASQVQPDTIWMAVFVARQRRMYEIELLRARKESEQIAEVVKRSSDAILRLNAEGIIESWNSGAQQLFGYGEADAIGKSLLLLFTQEKCREIEDSFNSLKLGQEQGQESIARHRSSQEFPVSISLTPHMEAPGILVGFSAIIRDTTRRSQAEKALLQAEKLASVGRLASSIAHEINNPLEAVTNLLYILRSRVQDPEDKALVQTAEEELARVSQIATHTLRFHKQSTSQTLVELKDVVENVLGLYRARLQNAGIHIAMESKGCSPLLCYENELRQVLLNLIANAFDAMRSGGRLTIRIRDRWLVARTHCETRIMVSDTGTGMDRATLGRIFEPFFSTKGIGGTGLGLWISKDLVARNGGSIRVRSSQRPGSAGTTFLMTFPHQPSPNRIDSPPNTL